jgi:hypothetical protein
LTESENLIVGRCGIDCEVGSHLLCLPPVTKPGWRVPSVKIQGDSSKIQDFITRYLEKANSLTNWLWCSGEWMASQPISTFSLGLQFRDVLVTSWEEEREICKNNEWWPTSSRSSFIVNSNGL